MFLELVGLVFLLLLQLSIKTRLGRFDPLQSLFGTRKFHGEGITTLRLPKRFITFYKPASNL